MCAHHLGLKSSGKRTVCTRFFLGAEFRAFDEISRRVNYVSPNVSVTRCVWCCSWEKFERQSCVRSRALIRRSGKRKRAYCVTRVGDLIAERTRTGSIYSWEQRKDVTDFSFHCFAACCVFNKIRTRVEITVKNFNYRNAAAIFTLQEVILSYF